MEGLSGAAGACVIFPTLAMSFTSQASVSTGLHLVHMVLYCLQSSRNRSYFIWGFINSKTTNNEEHILYCLGRGNHVARPGSCDDVRGRV
ncbi:hypothetical protein EDB89DRAFT_1958218 [Lactarius sanguifluus]|nr:hypothetical protein EDB89DRAFT_1958218 [Lactarius sanguifluus]